MYSPPAIPPLSSASSSAAFASSAAEAAGSAVDTLSPSISSKQRTALDQLCDFAITNKNTKDMDSVASTEGDAAKLLASLTPNPVPPDGAAASAATPATTAPPTSRAVKTCVIQAKPPLPPSTATTPSLVRIYDGEERRTKIGRYLEKRKHKTWTRQVRYPSRQGSADSRNRVKGRFVSKKDQAAAAMASAA